MTETSPFADDFQPLHRYLTPGRKLSWMITASAAMHQSLADHPIYPSHRAFVPQFHREADLKASRCLGRIEQVVSGKVRYFQSVEELLTFLVERLDEENDRIDPSEGGQRRRDARDPCLAEIGKTSTIN